MEHTKETENNPETDSLMNAATREFISKNRLADVRRLAFSAGKNPDVDVPFALDQIEGWQTARHKLPSWAAIDGIIYPPHLNMEQCSSEQTARYKQAKTSPDLPKGEGMELPLNLESVTYAEENKNSCAENEQSLEPSTKQNNDTNAQNGSLEFNTVSPSPPLRGGWERSPRILLDLTGGFGVDFSFLSQCFSRAIYIERNPQLCKIAKHNFRLLGLTNVEVVNADGIEFFKSFTSNQSPSRTGGARGGSLFIYLDPARRDVHGHKVYNIADCEPDVVTLAPMLLSKADKIMIKLSPMFDWREAIRELPCVTEVHIVSVKNECKELLVVLSNEKNKKEESLVEAHSTSDNQPHLVNNIKVHCVNDNSDFTFLFNPQGNQSPPLRGGRERSLPNSFLLVPNASIMKAGCFAEVASQFNIRVLSENSHLFISAHSIDNFPGRQFQMIAVSSMNKKELRRNLQGIDKANISVRNFPLSVDALRKRLKIADGGDVYIFATTTADGAHVLIITKKVA